MKSLFNRGVSAAGDFRRSRPKEVYWSTAGIVAGAASGFLIGGVGIAAGGSAVGIPAAFILAIVGGLIGNRIGVEIDRRSMK